MKKEKKKRKKGKNEKKKKKGQIKIEYLYSRMRNMYKSEWGEEKKNTNQPITAKKTHEKAHC